MYCVWMISRRIPCVTDVNPYGLAEICFTGSDTQKRKKKNKEQFPWAWDENIFRITYETQV